MIRKTDTVILLAFLARESFMYNWARTGEEGREKFVKKMYDAITSTRPGQAFNYVHIQSITNMGLLDSELVLSGEPFDSENDIFLTLPPSPRGGIGVLITPHIGEKR